MSDHELDALRWSIPNQQQIPRDSEIPRRVLLVHSNPLGKSVFQHFYGSVTRATELMGALRLATEPILSAELVGKSYLSMRDLDSVWCDYKVLPKKRQDGKPPKFHSDIERDKAPVGKVPAKVKAERREAQKRAAKARRKNR